MNESWRDRAGRVVARLSDLRAQTYAGTRVPPSQKVRDVCQDAIDIILGAAMEMGENRAAGQGLPDTDPWKHRAVGMRCSTCMWYAVKTAEPLVSDLLAGHEQPKAIGRCRRHAPSMTGYPVVYPTDWCGDHKLDETKR